jgi:uncharacterized DUF497 family protein
MASRRRTGFEWDSEKDLSNQEKHGVSFIAARMLSLTQTVLFWKM